MTLLSLTEIAWTKHIVAWTAVIVASAPDCVVSVSSIFINDGDAGPVAAVWSTHACSDLNVAFLAFTGQCCLRENLHLHCPLLYRKWGACAYDNLD